MCAVGMKGCIQFTNFSVSLEWDPQKWLRSGTLCGHLSNFSRHIKPDLIPHPSSLTLPSGVSVSATSRGCCEASGRGDRVHGNEGPRVRTPALRLWPRTTHDAYCPAGSIITSSVIKHTYKTARRTAGRMASISSTPFANSTTDTTTYAISTSTSTNTSTSNTNQCRILMLLLLKSS